MHMQHADGVAGCIGDGEHGNLMVLHQIECFDSQEVTSQSFGHGGHAICHLYPKAGFFSPQWRAQNHHLYHPAQQALAINHGRAANFWRRSPGLQHTWCLFLHYGNSSPLSIRSLTRSSSFSSQGAPDGAGKIRSLEVLCLGARMQGISQRQGNSRAGSGHNAQRFIFPGHRAIQRYISSLGQGRVQIAGQGDQGSLQKLDERNDGKHFTGIAAIGDRDYHIP